MLIDFGVARSLAEDARHRPTHVEASLPYTAPELLHGRTRSAAADEYALACTAVELLTGAPPFTVDTSIALMDAHLNRPVPRVLPPDRLDSTARSTRSWPRRWRRTRTSATDTCAEFVALITRALR